MTYCKGENESGSNFDQMKFVSETPHFFKIILNNSVGDDKLQVPQKFVNMYGDAIPSRVQLKVPNGEIWSVEFKRYDNGEVWLINGWKEFGEHYSLRYGDMVLFKHKENDHVSVVIFDKSATEIEYPHNNTHSKVKEPSIVEIEDDTSVESFGHLSRRKRREISPLPSTRGRKMKRTVQEKNTISSTSHANNSSKAKAKLISSTHGFKSKCPFFRVVMRASYVLNKGAYMNLPLKFARRHLNEGQGDFNLKVSDGRSWNVEYRHTGNTGCLKTARFYNGWNVFVRENKLKVNDVCIFELENDKGNTLNVSIFGAKEDINCDISLASTSRGYQAIPKTVPHSKHPLFKVVMPRCSIEQRHMRLPSHFVEKYGKKLGTCVTLHTAGESWNVKYNEIFGLFTTGWSIFVKDNCIQVGDTCFFELIQTAPAEFKVTISGCSV